jgi:hypothetical protein
MSQIGETIFLPGMPVPGSPISTGTAASAGGGLEGLFGGAGGLATSIGMGLFGNILGKTIGGFFNDMPWGTQAQADAKIAEWLKNNPLMPDGSSRERSAVAAPSAPGYVQDEQGYYRNTNDPTDQGYYVISGNTPIKVTPPLVPVPKPTTGAAATGGASSGGSAGSNQPTFGQEGGNMNAPVDMDGGFVNIGIDPDLIGGSPGGIGEPGGEGPTEMDKPPTEYTDAEWSQIIKDWFIRFPDASDADKEAAITQYGVPRDVVAQVLAEQAGTGFPGGEGTGGDGGTGTGDGTGTGTGTGGSTGGTVTPTVPIVPPTAPVGDTGAGTGTGTGTGAGSGSGGSSGSPGGMFTGQGPLPSEIVFPELFKLKKDYEVLNNLLTYRPQGLFR